MHGPRTLALWQHSTERANWTSDHCHCYSKTYWERSERMRWDTRRENTPVCMFKTLPCKRSNHPCPMWHGRLERTHGSVLNVHTEAFFSARQVETHNTTPHHTTPHHTTPNRTAPHRTAPHRTAPHRTAPHCTALHCTALHCPSLPFTTPHSTTHTTQRHVKREPNEKRERVMKRERDGHVKIERESFFSNLFFSFFFFTLIRFFLIPFFYVFFI